VQSGQLVGSRVAVAGPCSMFGVAPSTGVMGPKGNSEEMQSRQVLQVGLQW
jgi:hypothetical protein